MFQYKLPTVLINFSNSLVKLRVQFQNSEKNLSQLSLNGRQAHRVKICCTSLSPTTMAHFLLIDPRIIIDCEFFTVGCTMRSIISLGAHRTWCKLSYERLVTNNTCCHCAAVHFSVKVEVYALVYRNVA